VPNTFPSDMCVRRLCYRIETSHKRVNPIHPNTHLHTYTPTHLHTYTPTMSITSTYTFQTPTITEHHESVAQRKQAIRLSHLPTSTLIPQSSPLALSVEDGGPIDVSQGPKESGLLSEKEIQITEMDVGKLLIRLRKGEISARAVIEAFIKRASIAQQLVCPSCHRPS
jgi:hypothetical protein